MTPTKGDEMLEKKIDALKIDLDKRHHEESIRNDERHKQNRSDIHAFRNDLQRLTDEHHTLQMRLTPVLGLEGEPGAWHEITGDVREIKDNLIRLSGEEEGRKEATREGWNKVKNWCIVITVIIVALSVFIAYLDYKKADHQGLLSGTSFTQKAEVR